MVFVFKLLLLFLCLLSDSELLDDDELDEEDSEALSFLDFFLVFDILRIKK